MHRPTPRRATPLPSRGRARRSLTVAVLVGALVLAGCGSGGGSKSASGCRSADDAAKATQPTVKAGAAATKLETVDLIKGCGAVIKAGDPVLLNYVGVSVTTGKVFDASYPRDQPLPFTAGGQEVIPGFAQGVIGARVGGRREIRIPPALGYGAASQPDIPANDTLVFVVDLLAPS